MKKQMIRLALSCVVLAFLYVWFFPLSKISQIEIRLEDSPPAKPNLQLGTKPPANSLGTKPSANSLGTKPVEPSSQLGTKLSQTNSTGTNPPPAWFEKKQTKIMALTETYKHKYFWQISFKKLAQKLQKTDKELDIRLKRKYPGQLIVFVSKKKTALLLLDANKHFYSVSCEGLLGPKRKPKEDLDFPILRGSALKTDLKLRQKLLKILEFLPQNKDFCRDNLSEIVYNKPNQSFLFYLKSHRFVLELKSVPLFTESQNIELCSPSGHTKLCKPSQNEKNPNTKFCKKIQNIEFVLNYLNEKNWTQAFIIAESDKKIIVKNKK